MNRNGEGSREVTVIVRVDDYPTGNVEGRVWPQLEEFYSVFDGLMESVPYLLGVVPAFVGGYEYQLHHVNRYTYENFRGHKVEFAVHGYDHSSATVNQPYNEFTGLNEDGAYDRLKKGFDILQPFNPRVFIAPFNRYTNATLRALERLRCKYVTTGPETAEQDLDFGNLTAIPSDFYGKSEQILEQIRQKGLAENRVQCIALHWTWEIQGIVNNNGRLPELLKLIAPHVKPWREVFGW